MDRDVLAERLSASLQALRQNDAMLLEYNANERAISAKVAMYLTALFPSYDVDADYNRHGKDPKEVYGLTSCQSGLSRNRVIPDVIVHKRGNDDANLLVVEIKKSTNREPRECDRSKLKAIGDTFNYRFRALIDIETGPRWDRVPFRVEWL